MRSDADFPSYKPAPIAVDTGAVTDHPIIPIGMRRAAETIKGSKPQIAQRFNRLADHLETVIGYLQSIGEIAITGPRRQFAIAAQKEGRTVWNIHGGKQRLRWVLHHAESLGLTEVEISTMLMHGEVHESESNELRAIDRQIMLFEWQELAGRDPNRARGAIETITGDEECQAIMREYLHLVVEQKFSAAGIFRVYNYINGYRDLGLDEEEGKNGILHPVSYFLSQEDQDHYQPKAHPDIHFEFSAQMYSATVTIDEELSQPQRGLIGSLPVYFALTPPEKVVVTADAGLTREKLAAFSDDLGTLYIHWAGFDRL